MDLLELLKTAGEEISDLKNKAARISVLEKNYEKVVAELNLSHKKGEELEAEVMALKAELFPIRYGRPVAIVHICTYRDPYGDSMSNNNKYEVFAVYPGDFCEKIPSEYYNKYHAEGIINMGAEGVKKLGFEKSYKYLYSIEDRS